MYGMKVHQAVVDRYKEPESGITIHYVNDKYDEGQDHISSEHALSLIQPILPLMLPQRIHMLEYAHFPQIIEQVLNDM